MPEVPQDVVFPGTKPKVRAKGPEEEEDSDNEESYPNERPNRRQIREAREELVMQNADKLTEWQYLGLSKNKAHTKKWNGYFFCKRATT